MSRLLSPLLLAALCWVSGHHCLKNKICNWVEDPSVQCMYDAMEGVINQLAYSIDLVLPNVVLSGRHDNIWFNLSDFRLIRVNRVIVNDMAWGYENLGNFSSSASISKPIRTDLTLEWPTLFLGMNVTWAPCPNNQCGQRNRTYSTILFNLAKVAFSWGSSLANDSRHLRLGVLSDGEVQLDVISESFGDRVAFPPSNQSAVVKAAIRRAWDMHKEVIMEQLRKRIHAWFRDHVLVALVDAVAGNNATEMPHA